MTINYQQLRTDSHIKLLNILRIGFLNHISRCRLLFVMTLFITTSAFSQPQKVCIGTKSVYAATGLPGSTYNYSLEAIAGTIIETPHKDTIIVEWGYNKGIYELGVQEVSAYGDNCVGDWAFLEVELVGEYANFNDPFYTMCGSTGVLIDFNKSDFQSWTWLDNSVSSDGYITAPGIYELLTVDHNNCTLSSFVEVIEVSPPKVTLEKDKKFCTTSFTLFVQEANDNPAGTIYYWSTGESGELLSQIEIRGHDITKDQEFWARAEFSGCETSDTIMIYRCQLDPPEQWENKIPNTFTPNDDGDNDVWNIVELADYLECVVEVFDRWGRRVFNSQPGYPIPWNGQDDKGRLLPMETYYYFIHLNDGIHKKPITGTITIIR